MMQGLGGEIVRLHKFFQDFSCHAHDNQVQEKEYLFESSKLLIRDSQVVPDLSETRLFQLT